MKITKPHALAVQEWLDGKIYTEIQINNSTMSVLSGKVLLGISGGIAAYKTASLVRLYKSRCTCPSDNDTCF
jgi:hypothetical protein